MPAPDLPPHAFAVVPARPTRLFLHADHARAADFEGSTTIVVDAIRASTTMVTALELGAVSIVPVLTIEDALAKKAELERGGERGALLGGERGGVLIPGFDLDNSPRSYSRDRIGGRTIVFTTANGTAGLLLAERSERIVVGAFVNADAVARAVAGARGMVTIVCCGTRGDVGMDDCLAGGAIAERLVGLGRGLVQDDAARLCMYAWREARQSGRGLREILAETRGGRYLHLQGCEGDLEICAAVDRCGVVPVFDARTGRIDVARSAG